MILNDLEPPKIGVYGEFFAISGCVTHFKSELHRNGPKQVRQIFVRKEEVSEMDLNNLRMTFLALRI